MTAFKQLLASDIIVTPFKVSKAFQFIGASQLTGSNVGIDRFLGVNLTGLFSPLEATTGEVTSEYQRLVYNSAKELYYSNYLNSSYGSPVSVPYILPGWDATGNVLTGPASSAGRYENYLETTLTYERYFPTGANAVIGVISVPSKLYGDKIQPGSFRLEAESGSLSDDGNGNLIFSLDNEIRGNIIYQHGLAIITNNTTGTGGIYGTATYGTSSYGTGLQPFLQNLISSSNATCSFSSSFTIYETQYKCTIDTSEFNFSQNPSMINNSETGQVYDFATGSYFNPYLTTVGLYNENQDLIAVGKLAKPLPTNNTTDLTILINIDR
jgi:hypothetical protein